MSEPRTQVTRKRLYENPAIIAAVIGLLASPITILIKNLTADPPMVLYHFTVNDSGSGRPIGHAEVRLVLDVSGKISPLNDLTDDSGAVYLPFPLPKAVLNKFGRVEARASGYQARTLPIQLSLNQPGVGILLTPMPAIQPPPPRVKLEAYSLTKSSGPVPGGLLSDFSPPYTVESDPPRDGYKIVSASYSLSGDRTCNAWSTCRWRQNDENRAVFEFTLQGHSEWFPPRQAMSTGTITVVYGPR